MKVTSSNIDNEGTGQVLGKSIKSLIGRPILINRKLPAGN